MFCEDVDLIRITEQVNEEKPWETGIERLRSWCIHRHKETQLYRHRHLHMYVDLDKRSREVCRFTVITKTNCVCYCKADQSVKLHVIWPCIWSRCDITSFLTCYSDTAARWTWLMTLN